MFGKHKKCYCELLRAKYHEHAYIFILALSFIWSNLIKTQIKNLFTSNTRSSTLVQRDIIIMPPSNVSPQKEIVVIVWSPYLPYIILQYIKILQELHILIFDVVFGFATNMCNVTIKRLGKVVIYDMYFVSKV